MWMRCPCCAATQSMISHTASATCPRLNISSHSAPSAYFAFAYTADTRALAHCYLSRLAPPRSPQHLARLCRIPAYKYRTPAACTWTNTNCFTAPPSDAVQPLYPHPARARQQQSKAAAEQAHLQEHTKHTQSSTQAPRGMRAANQRAAARSDANHLLPRR
jgi:hypothetical protein